MTSNQREFYYYNFYRNLENQYNKNETIFRNNNGLYSGKNSKNEFNLESFDINANIIDTSVIQEWIQVYSNNSRSTIEAKYQLPISSFSVVSKFVVEYKDKRLEAKIKEKTKAIDKYNDTIASGGQAYLGEIDENGFFKISIGNIPPNENVTIRLVILSEIGTISNELHFLIHKYLFPVNSFSFNFKLQISLSEPFVNIHFLEKHYIPTMKCLDGDKNQKAEIEFNSPNGIQNNIAIVIETKLKEKPQYFLEYDQINQSMAMVLHFYPNYHPTIAEQVNQKSEYIFIIDCSGSMAGSSIEKAKRSLELGVRSLNFEKSKFNIYCFGSTFNKMFHKSEIFNDETLSQAMKYIDRIKADLGGTVLSLPIYDIFGIPNDEEYPRQILLLTDGCIDDKFQLIDYISTKSNISSTRIFTFGIGNSVDRELVISLSKISKGFYEFINDNNTMEEQVMKLMTIANEPILSNIKINWGFKQLSHVIQSPSVVKSVFNGERLIVYGILDDSAQVGSLLNGSNKIYKIKMTGDSPIGGAFEFEIDLDFNNIHSSNNNQIHILAAFKRIQELQELESKNSNHIYREKIIELGKKYKLASKYTSFIVSNENTGEIVTESMKTISAKTSNHFINNFNNNHINNSIQNNSLFGNGSIFNLSSQSSTNINPFTGVSNQFSGSLFGNIPPRTSQKSKNKVYFVEQPCLKPPEISLDPLLMQQYELEVQKSLSLPLPEDDSDWEFDNNISTTSTNTNTNNNENDKLYSLLRCQFADGSFEKTSILSLQSNFVTNEMLNKIPKELSKSPNNEKIWITILIISIISKSFSNQRSKWENIINKSKKWVKNQLASFNLLNKLNEYETLSNSLI